VPATTTSSRLRRRLDAAIDSLVAGLPDPAAATVSVWLGAPGGPASFEREAAATHYAASTMKLPLVVAAYRMAEQGAVDLDARVPVHDDFASAYDGSRFVMRQDYDQDDGTWAEVGGTATLRDLARHAIVKSGNLATNLVLEQVGTSAVAAVLRDAGCSPATVVTRGIEDSAARGAGMDNLVTAADLSLVLGAVAMRTIAGWRTCEEVESVLAAQEHRDQVPAGLPPGTYVANKTGWIDHVAHDVALVRPDHRPDYVLTLCTSAEADEQTLYALNAGISRAVWEAWTS
jgi:beta-lactamase class A